MMADAQYDVAGVGNAIVDVLASTDDGFLAEYGMAKGGMALVDEARAHALYEAMGPAIESSGGSAANTIAGLASLGGKGVFIGRVKDDEFGQIFRHDLTSLGVNFTCAPAAEGAATARCLIFVTPDAERTMNTHLGACIELDESDIDPALITGARITYLEGYLFDPPQAQNAFRKAASLAREAGRKVALTLSDRFCVERHRNSFLELIRDDIDILFANEEEIDALLGPIPLAQAADLLAGQVEIAAITRGARGSLLVRSAERVEVPAGRIDQLVDTTGAGDLYASGVLFGLCQDMPLAQCGHLGSTAAAEVIGHYGARPEVPLVQLAGI